jgi:basic membrane protein A
MGAPTACENAGIPNVSYNGSTVAACPNTFIISSRINWAPYFEYIINCVENGEEIAVDWCKGITEGSVELSDINETAAAAGTAEKLEEVKAGLADGSIKVFDSATFTVNGAPVDSHIVEDTNEVISDGYFHESEIRSAPYFDLRIDGIKLLNEAY